MKIRICTFAFAVIAMVHALAESENSDERLVGYDEIVRDIQSQLDRPARKTIGQTRSKSSSEDPFAQVQFHFGIGALTTNQTLALPGHTANYNGHGMQATFGIDLLSKHWLAEGAVRNSEGQPDSTTHGQLKEFDLRLIYRNRIGEKLDARLGGGLSGRYATIDRLGVRQETSAPLSIAMLGLDFFVGQTLSFGIEGSYRNALVNETPDRSSFDATLRLDTHF